MKFFDAIIDWGTYILEWFAYVTNCAKAIIGSVSHLRNSWPARPVISRPQKSKAIDTADTAGAGDQSADGKVLGSSISV